MTQIPTVVGVQELIDRIRTEGVESAQQEGQRILHESRSQADAVLSQARREAQETRNSAQKQIEAEKQAALEALRLAARNTVMDLKSKVAVAFERQVRRLVGTSMKDQQFVRDLVLTLAGQASQQVVQGQSIEILLSPQEASAPPGTSGGDRLRELIPGVSLEMLREGVTLVPDETNHRGARVRIVGSNMEIDLSEEAVTRLMLQHMLPRFRSILGGVE